MEGLPNLNLAAPATSSSNATGGNSIFGGASSGIPKLGLIKILALIGGAALIVKIWRKGGKK